MTAAGKSLVERLKRRVNFITSSLGDFSWRPSRAQIEEDRNALTEALAQVERLEREKAGNEALAIANARSAAEVDRVMDQLYALVQRYREDTPLGHQPHMISAEVEKVLEQADAIRARRKGETGNG